MPAVRRTRGGVNAAFHNDYAAKAAAEVNPWEIAFFNKTRERWAEHGELISLPANEQADLIRSVTAVGAKRKPRLEQAYDDLISQLRRNERNSESSKRATLKVQ
jgi:hypothetical protein